MRLMNQKKSYTYEKDKGSNMSFENIIRRGEVKRPSILQIISNTTQIIFIAKLSANYNI